MTEPNFPDTVEELRAFTARLQFTDEAIDLGAEVAPDTAADTAPGMRPRPVSMTDDLDLRSGLRAADLSLSRSAYVRRLIEQDLRTADLRIRDVAPE
jgi:hypothetical protein